MLLKSVSTKTLPRFARISTLAVTRSFSFSLLVLQRMQTESLNKRPGTHPGLASGSIIFLDCKLASGMNFALPALCEVFPQEGKFRGGLHQDTVRKTALLSWGGENRTWYHLGNSWRPQVLITPILKETLKQLYIRIQMPLKFRTQLNIFSTRDLNWLNLTGEHHGFTLTGPSSTAPFTDLGRCFYYYYFTENFSVFPLLCLPSQAGPCVWDITLFTKTQNLLYWDKTTYSSETAQAGVSQCLHWKVPISVVALSLAA